MLTIKYGRIQESRDQIRDYCQLQKYSDDRCQIIDIGGVVNGWSADFVDVVADINATRLTDFRMNVSVEEDWDELLDYVKNAGLFDYAICTHTIEDISNPQLLLRNLPKIAKRGIITAPSVRTEMSHVEDPRWRGYIHHRHLIGHDNQQIILAPKLGFLSAFDVQTFDPLREEIVIEWTWKLPFSMIMRDYLGPNIETVLQSYNEFIKTNI